MKEEIEKAIASGDTRKALITLLVWIHFVGWGEYLDHKVAGGTPENFDFFTKISAKLNP